MSIEDAPQAEAPREHTLEELTLSETIREIEQHVARGGWDGPPRVFAIIRTREALAASPDLATQMPELPGQVEANEHAMLSVEQEELPPADTLEELLGALAWPGTVHGAAIVVERVIVPPEAEAGMPRDADEALEYLAQHPDREDVRLAVAVLRDGPSWCAIRTRRNDDATQVALGPDLVPGLVSALRATFED